jgi:hypothetical protein
VRGGDFGVWEELVPAAISPEGFQAHEGFVTSGGPELAGAFETALVLAAGGFDGARTQRFIGFEDLGGSGVAFLDGFSGLKDFPVGHAAGVVLEIINLFLDFFLEALGQAGLKFLEAADESRTLIVVQLVEQRLNPLPGFGSVLAIKFVGHAPEVFLAVVKVQALASLGKAVGDRVPNPEGAVGNDQHAE